MEVIELHL